MLPMESHGQSPWYLGQRHVGRHSPSYAGMGRSHDGAFLLPVKPGGLLLPE
jgi:hypothetical protein